MTCTFCVQVVQYIAFGDKTDDTGSHGTHVSGIIAGNAVGSDPARDGPDVGTGMAPDAKISMLDVSNEVSE